MKNAFKILPVLLVVACGSTKEETNAMPEKISNSENQTHPSGFKLDNLSTAYIDPNSAVYLATNFQVFVTSTLTAHDNAIIGPAAKLMHEKLNNATSRNAIVSCANSNSTKEKPNLTTFTNNLSYVFQNPSRPIKLYVGRISNEISSTNRFVAARAPTGNGGAASTATCTNATFPECGWSGPYTNGHISQLI